jgi:RING finger protein 121
MAHFEGHGHVEVDHADLINELKNEERDRMRRELSPHEALRKQHMQFHEKHRGHEQMHAEMFIILIVTLLLAQIVLVEWKKRHYRSYMMLTLVGMWTIPICFSGYNLWYRFIFTWCLFTILSGTVVKKALEKPLSCTTPRLVYKWFYLVHKVSYAMGIAGYCIMMATIMGLNFIFNANPHTWMDVAIMLLFYGLYYGVLSRDLAEICADKMAVKIGYYAKDGFPTKTPDENICAICGNKLLVSSEEEGVIEDTFKLSCNHVFHEFCIRGWCIVGKKQTCPFCNEKVDLKRMVNNFWEKPHVLYGQLLDWVRWLVAWQPLIYFLVQGINWLLGLH